MEWGHNSPASFRRAGGFVRINPAPGRSLGCQFDWNPWVEVDWRKETMSPSATQSYDLAGVTLAGKGSGSFPSGDSREPRRWVLDGVRLAIEYSYSADYSQGKGGTGRSANGFLTTLTYVW
jgi:hypothetical protein